MNATYFWFLIKSENDTKSESSETEPCTKPAEIDPKESETVFIKLQNQ